MLLVTGDERLTHAEEIRLAKRIRKGDRSARERLVTCNIRLIHGIADRYTGRGVDRDELVSAGAVGLLKAADAFRPTGVHFATVAAIWIRREILNAVCQFRGPFQIKCRSAAGFHSRMRAARERLQAELGYAPTLEEIRAKAGLREWQFDMAVNLDTDRWHRRGMDDAAPQAPDAADDDEDQLAARRRLDDLARRAGLTTEEYAVLSFRLGVATGGPVGDIETARELAMGLKTVKKAARTGMAKLRGLRRADVA